MNDTSPTMPHKRRRSSEEKVASGDGTDGSSRGEAGILMARLSKPPCCYVSKKLLVYGAYVGRVPVAAEGGVAMPSQRLATRCAYTDNTFLDRSVVTGVVAELEGPLMAPTPLMFVKHECIGAYAWAPLSPGDLVVTASRRPAGYETPHETLRRVATSGRCRFKAFDPYDATVPAHMAASALTLFAVHRLGRLDTVFLVPVATEDVEDTLHKASIGPSIASVKHQEVGEMEPPMRFKRSDVRKLVRFHTPDDKSTNGAVSVRHAGATADRVRRMLEGKLMAAGSPTSALVEALSSEHVRLSANGSGIGHSIHKQTPTLKEVNDAFNNQ